MPATTDPADNVATPPGTDIPESDPLAQAAAAYRAGELGRAAARCERLLATEPDRGPALQLLAAVRAAQGQSAAALALLQRCAGAAAPTPELLYNIGVLHAALGDADAAVAAYDRALALRPEFPEALNNRGHALATLGRHDEALANYDRALAARPDDPDALNNRGNALLALDRADEALACFDRALARRPSFAEALNNRGNALPVLGRQDAALAAFEAALQVKPGYVDALYNSGNALAALMRFEDAVGRYDAALAVDPNHAEALYNRGIALQSIWRYEEAVASYDRALAARPDFPAAAWNRALARLSLGDYERGWPEYESRWAVPGFPSPKRNFPRPMWRGEDAAGKTILLHAEQGFGDTLQFCRYAPLVVRRGLRVIIEVQPPLQRLLRTLDGVSAVLARGDVLPPFDLHCPMMSLPLAFGTTVASIPAEVPYLRPPADAVTRWAPRLAGSVPRVGLVWSGSPGQANNSRRSLALAQLRPVLDDPRFEYHALQKEIGDDDRRTMATIPRLIDHSAELDDFADTAALVDGMDLVIAIDTSVAHLAGALGKPLWLMLWFLADWRYFVGRTDSPWYPTARQFWQPQRGAWQPVVDAVAAQLKNLNPSRR